MGYRGGHVGCVSLREASLVDRRLSVRPAVDGMRRSLCLWHCPQSLVVQERSACAGPCCESAGTHRGMHMDNNRRQRTVLALGIVAACGGAFADGPAQIPPAEHGLAIAVPGADGPMPVWGGPADDGHDRIPSHPPLHLIPPMPMPDPADDNPGAPMGVPLVHDGATGQIVQYPMYPPSGADGGEGSGYEAPFGEFFDERFMTAGFGTKSLITSVGADPWRRNVKVVMRFVDQSGNDRFFVCSGTMADPEVVITAGHCVYARQADGPDIFDWAEEFWIYPGWDGDGITADQAQIIQTHGIGYGTASGAFTGWTQNGSFDWDMGLVRINRSVGHLTSWFGWAWGFDCGTIKSRTYHNASYPAENCPTSGLHNGRDMYYWFGGIDDCPGNQMEINTSPGCLTAGWGGESGSGVYYFNDNNDRLVHGVASNSNRSTVERFAKMWESFKDFMIDFENDSRGSSLDLQMLRARYVGSSVTAGQTIQGDDYVVSNPTNNNPASSSYSVSHYLSTNAFISSADTLVRSESFSFDFAPVQSVTVNTTGINYTIPIGTPSGTYYLGTVLNTTDANTGNNNAEYWDTHEIQVNGVADIVANSVSAPSSGFLGENVNVSFNAVNQGGDPSNSVTVQVRLSTNTFISTSDTLLGTFVYSGRAGGQTLSDTVSVSIPSGSGTGTRYIGIIVDASDDVDSSNDTAVSDAVDIGARSDLVATSINAANGTHLQGGSMPISFRVDNDGLAPSGDYTVEIRASTNTFISTSDPLLRTYNFSTLNPGAARSVNSSVAIPPSFAPSDYFIGMIVSPGADENDTSDNINLDSTAVTIADCPPDLTGRAGNGVSDGAVDANDFFFYLQLFADSDSRADLTGPGGDGVPDGVIDANDFFFYLQLFAAGCP